MRFLIILFLLTSALFADFKMRVMTYNLLNYDGTSREAYFESVVEAVDPDIFVVQEVVNAYGIQQFREAVLNNEYFTIDFHDGPTTDNHIFYDPYQFIFRGATYIDTDLRDIAEYQFEIASNEVTFYLYSVHLKASSGEENEQKRLNEATILRNHLNNHDSLTNFIVAGDFNIYNDNEPAYQKLTGSAADNDGRLFDPINQSAWWHNNSNYANIHTQSTRREQLSDGSSGGLDDRFDFILVSEALLDEVVVESYQSFGNDGKHFNQSINYGTNSAVSADVADALYYASDHLPVYCDFVFSSTAIEPRDPAAIVNQATLHQNYPNPFNPVTQLRYSMPAAGRVNLSIYNPLGEKTETLVNDHQSVGTRTVKWDASVHSGGIYFAVLKIDGQPVERRKIVFLK